MKYLFAFLLLIFCVSGVVVGQNIGDSTTSYKPGFKYWDYNSQVWVTLLKWQKIPASHGFPPIWRWRTRLVNKFGFTIKEKTWTDECWIDLNTGKAYYDEEHLRIINIETGKTYH